MIDPLTDTRSQHTNTKLRVVAEQLMMDFRSLQWGQLGPPSSTFDDVFVTAHERDNDV